MSGKKGRSGKHGNQTGPTRDKRTRAIDRAEVIVLMRRGWTYQMIGEKLGIDKSVVYYDFKAVLKEMNEHRDADLDQLVALKMEEYAEVKREAWDAWERSKEDAHKIVEERPDPPTRECRYCRGSGRIESRTKSGVKLDVCARCVGKGVVAAPKKVTETITGQRGDPRFLQVIQGVLQAERDLKALNPAKELNIKATSVNWDILCMGIDLNAPVPDIIEQEIAKALGHDPNAEAIGNEARHVGVGK